MTPTASKRTDVFICLACVDRPRRVPMIGLMPVANETPHVGFSIGIKRQRTLSGKRFFSASLAAHEGIADKAAPKVNDANHQHSGKLLMYSDAQPETHPSASACGMSCRTNNMASKKKAQSNQRHRCQHMAKLSRPTNQRPLTPSASTLQSTLLDVVRDQALEGPP